MFLFPPEPAQGRLLHIFRVQGCIASGPKGGTDRQVIIFVLIVLIELSVDNNKYKIDFFSNRMYLRPLSFHSLGSEHDEQRERN
jgi:hypothetical protein